MVLPIINSTLFSVKKRQIHTWPPGKYLSRLKVCSAKGGTLTCRESSLSKCVNLLKVKATKIACLMLAAPTSDKQFHFLVYIQKKCRPSSLPQNSQVSISKSTDSRVCVHGVHSVDLQGRKHWYCDLWRHAKWAKPGPGGLILTEQFYLSEVSTAAISEE